MHGDTRDDLDALSGVTPPADLTTSAVSTVAAVVALPLVAAAGALLVHPLTLAPAFLGPALGAPTFAALALARWQSQDGVARVAIVIAAAASTLFYLCLFSLLIASARLAGSVLLGL